MTLKLGEKAPEICAVTTTGKKFVLSEQQGLCTVVFFFPRAFTATCIHENKMFAADYNELFLAGAGLVGISTDTQATQCEFAKDLAIPFPLISDADKTIAKAYGALRRFFGFAKRITYIIGPDQRVLGRFQHELRVAKHRREVLRFVNEMKAASTS